MYKWYYVHSLLRGCGLSEKGKEGEERRFPALLFKQSIVQRIPSAERDRHDLHFGFLQQKSAHFVRVLAVRGVQLRE